MSCLGDTADDLGLQIRKKNCAAWERGESSLFPGADRGASSPRMGWRGLSLLKKNGNVVPAETWVEIYRGGGRNRANASDKEARDNYSRLSRMLEIRDGDRLIIPNLTKEG